MSSTRLLVLGAVRILQPVHGYDVRRELLTWRAEQWANVAPGSVYSALKTLERDGLIEVVGTGQEGARPARTTYRVTPEGDKEFAALLRETWWNVSTPFDPLMPAICFLPYMDRDELVAALGARVTQVDALIQAHRYQPVGGDPAEGGTPEHVAELWALLDAYLASQAEWARRFAERLEGGAYRDLTP